MRLCEGFASSQTGELSFRILLLDLQLIRYRIHAAATPYADKTRAFAEARPVLFVSLFALSKVCEPDRS